MSAYVLARSNFITIARFAQRYCNTPHGQGLHVYHPGNADPNNRIAPLDVANTLLNANLMSVAYRYKEDPENVPPIRAAEVGPHGAPKPVDMIGILRSLQYQSCERDAYNESLGNATLIALLWKVATVIAEEAGAETWAS